MLFPIVVHRVSFDRELEMYFSLLLFQKLIVKWKILTLERLKIHRSPWKSTRINTSLLNILNIFLSNTYHSPPTAVNVRLTFFEWALLLHSYILYLYQTQWPTSVFKPIYILFAHCSGREGQQNLQPSYLYWMAGY